jgi:hypothetical protein
MGWSAAETLEVIEGTECGARRHLMELHAIGIDLGEDGVSTGGLDSSGKVVAPKKCCHTQLLAYTANVRVQVGDRHGGLQWIAFPGGGLCASKGMRCD